MTRDAVLLTAWYLLLCGDFDCSGSCSFPKFLWHPSLNGSDRKWFGRTEYFRNSESWRKQEEITISRTEILIELRSQISCSVRPTDGGSSKEQSSAEDKDEDPDHNKLICYKKETLRRIVCLSEEPGMKYRVLDTTRGKSVFNCMKFVERSRSVVQIYKGIAKEINEDKLCFNDYFERDQWLWIAADRDFYESVFCSLRGGFDFFEASKTDANELLCADSWRPSRMEVECIRSDGLKFFFAQKRCNPFFAQNSENFQCSAVWTENGSKYIVFGYSKVNPRYILTVPEDIDHLDVFRATLFLSPFIPGAADSRDQTPSDTLWYQLDIIRSEPGVCFDESAACLQYAKEGKCTNTAVYHYANFCKRSCGLCEFAPSSKAECNFPSELVGYWVMFGEQEREEIAIETDQILFSTLGKFICKSKHWENDYYKVFSTFQNGCRPRYSCIRLSKTEDGTGLIDISSSDTMDRSFQLCDFDDRQNWPITGKARSWRTKILLPLSSMLDAKCGIGTWLEAEALLSDGKRCSGHVWDVNLSTCVPDSRLTVSSSKCHYPFSTEFLCTALAKMSEDTNFLVTLLHNNSNQTSTASRRNRYACWTQRMDNSSEHSVIEMKNVRCETGQTKIHSKDDKEITHLTLFRDQRTDAPCGPSMKETMDEPRPGLPTTSSSTSKWLSVKALYKPGFSVSIPGLFSYKNDLSDSAQQESKTDEQSGKSRTGDVDKQGVSVVEESVQNGATNSRIRKDQDLDYLANGVAHGRRHHSRPIWTQLEFVLVTLIITVYRVRLCFATHWGLVFLDL